MGAVITMSMFILLSGCYGTHGAESHNLWEESHLRGNQEVFQEAHWQMVRLGVNGTAGPWNAAVPLALVSVPGTLGLCDQTHKRSIRPFRTL